MPIAAATHSLMGIGPFLEAQRVRRLNPSIFYTEAEMAQMRPPSAVKVNHLGQTFAQWASGVEARHEMAAASGFPISASELRMMDAEQQEWEQING